MGTLDRRGLIAGVLSAAALPHLAQAAVPLFPRANQRFNILRNGKPFGSYRVNFATNGELTTVTTDVAMNMRVAGLQVFDYVHHCEEVWRGEQFQEMHARSVRDRASDQTDTVSAVRSNLAIHIVTNKASLSAPLNARPFTHWNQQVLKGPMFNPQDGTMLYDLAARPLGRDTVTLANGAKVPADHWAVRGKQEIDDWYDEAGVWAGLRAIFPDKSVIEYRRV